MPVAFTVPDGYGYSAFIALGVIPMVAFVQGAVVTTLRKASGVPYPHAYATIEQAKTNKDAYKFNCAQRAHGNLLENMPQTIACILFGGLFYPQATPILGAFWALSRVLYAYGYITSDKPNGRGRSIGLGHIIAQLGLIGVCVAGALKLM